MPHALPRFVVALWLVLIALPTLGDTSADDEALRTTIRAAGLRSNDLRVRIAWSVDGVEQRANGNWYSTETMPIATLVDQVRGSTDPVVLESMISRCAATPCRGPPSGSNRSREKEQVRRARSIR